MPIALLLAMQAAGMVTDYLGAKNQQNWMDMGAKLQQAGIESEIESNRLDTEDQSLQSLIALRKNLGTQMAVYAARGTSTANGSAVSFLTESIGNSNTDERMRRMNMLSKENQLKGGSLISKLNNSSASSKLWQGFAQRSINRFGTSSLYSGSSPFAGSKAGDSFGITQRTS